MTEVIHIKDAPRGWDRNPDFVFIGRGSIWGNTYVMGAGHPDGFMIPMTRDVVCDLFEERILPGLRKHLHLLRGKTLVCYCKPQRCHGDSLAAAADGRERRKLPMIYAGIGSRDISPAQIEVCMRLGRWFALQGHVLRTGNALGTDNAFAQGANQIDQELVHLFLPWKSYNRGQVMPRNKTWCVDADSTYGTSLMRKAEELHPAWGRLGQGGQKLMARNGGIIQGDTPSAPCVDLVLALPSLGKPGGGGTGQGIRWAESLDIEVVDLNTLDNGGLRALCERVRA